jgi:hypothetical protein
MVWFSIVLVIVGAVPTEKLCVAVLETPHSFVTCKITEYGPPDGYVIVPGFKVLAVAGVPPVNVHAYVKVPPVGAQLLTFTEGVIVAEPQAFGIGAIVTVGGFLTVTVWVVFLLPQELVTVNLIVYVPDSVKLKEAFGVVWLGIGVIDVPQKAGA